VLMAMSSLCFYDPARLFQLFDTILVVF
jgi:hypothetical protein